MLTLQFTIGVILNTSRMRSRILHSLPPLLLLFVHSGCDGGRRETGTDERVVVVYTALDRAFSEPIFEEFTRHTGIKVRAKYDTESTKTIGLTNRIRSEKLRPRCDVFWNNEILNTLELKTEGLLTPCHPAEAANYPARYRDRDGYWYGFAARARVLLVNTELVPSGADFPTSVEDLKDPAWKGRTAIAKPLFGTTASHAACWVATRGEAATVQFFADLRKNEIQIHGGNKGCAVAVARGAAAFALTDTDDARIEVEGGKPVRIVYPDSEDGGEGTLFLPNTVAIVRRAPHPEEARRLIDYLLSAEVEQRLAEGASAQIPLRHGAPKSTRVRGPEEVKPMEVDFEKAAAALGTARKLVKSHFLD
jgi:iron(III) transport system substrate-binding protein